MIRLVLPAYLFDLLPEDARLNSHSRGWVLLNPGSWSELVQEIRDRFPLLAQRVLVESVRMNAGFVLVINGEIRRTGYESLDFRDGEEIVIIAALAGG